jgi:hypothetical protein
LSAFWVMSGPGIPCGARKLGDDALGAAQPGRTWLDVCIIGQHLPQMYRDTEIRALKLEDCAALGLCPDCLGFGDASPVAATDALLACRGVDEVKKPCPGCGGSGRPALRVSIRRAGPDITGSIRLLPHGYVPPGDGFDAELGALFGASADMCMACGMPQDGTGPRGKALHQ